MDQSNNILREFQIRKLSDALTEKRQAEFVISTEAVDSYGTVFRLDGWDLSRYNANPVVLFGHRSNDGDPDNVIGVGEVFVEDNKLIGRVTFETEDVNPKAEKIYRKIQAGTLRMASIGAHILDGRMGNKERGEDPDVVYFTRQQLLEFSIVPIGSNPDALKRSAETMAEIKKQYTKPEEEFTGSTINEQAQTKVRNAQVLIYNY